MEKCRNCGGVVSDKYCSHCGQKVLLPRITAWFVVHEIIHFFTHLEKGFLFTTKQMLVDPGKAITGYIEGQRKPHQPPVSYFLIWTTVFIFTLYLFEKFYGENKIIVYNDYFGEGATTAYAISHLSIMLTLIIPVQSLYLFLLVTRGRFNYFETIVAGLYAIGTIIVLQFVFSLLSFGYALTLGVPADLRYSDLFKLGYFIWFTISLLRVFDIRWKWPRGILFILLAAGSFTAWRLIGVPQLAKLFM